LDISIQIFGIRWLRLLFGREFPMQDLLFLWDALLVDRPALDLVDSVCLALLIQIRDSCKCKYRAIQY
jgi:TBC1 domain family protein 5